MSYTYEDYDVAVIGAGHAGCEAALACARLGLKTIVFTVSVESIALMPCNPNIGGSSKGHLVREIDALGGQMGKTIDQTLYNRKCLTNQRDLRFILCELRRISRIIRPSCAVHWKIRRI